MEPNQSSPRNKRVLCVEDELFIGELYQRALSKAGYDITVEPDGQKGLDLALTNNYDIILLDLMVPSLTGLDILHKLRQPNHESASKAKIVIITNLEQRESAREEIEKQADAYIIKAAVTPKELVAFLDKLS